jgi:hypothetical protein
MGPQKPLQLKGGKVEPKHVESEPQSRWIEDLKEQRSGEENPLIGVNLSRRVLSPFTANWRIMNCNRLLVRQIINVVALIFPIWATYMPF